MRDIAWFSGLFEGEGCIYYRNRALVMTVGMTDKDVVDSIVDVLGVGKVKGPRHDGNPNHKERYDWYLCSRNDVMDVCARILPYLGKRRSSQVANALGNLERLPDKRQLKKSISCGLVSSEESTTKGAKRHYRNGEQPCFECRSAYNNYLRGWREANP